MVENDDVLAEIVKRMLDRMYALHPTFNADDIIIVINPKLGQGGGQMFGVNVIADGALRVNIMVMPKEDYERWKKINKKLLESEGEE